MSLHDYMAACLFDLDHGYYVKRAGIGRSGDFITAPEISQVFGELIGLWVISAWQAMGEPEGTRLIELGPGRGTLMGDALRAMAIKPAFLKGLSVHLVETSAPLRQEQAKALCAFEPAIQRLCWHSGIEEVPPGPAVVIANEFFDCFPVRQFLLEGGVWRERLVSVNERNEFFLTKSAQAVAPDLADGGLMAEAEEGAIIEIQPGAGDAMGRLAAREGLIAALVVDYGYGKASLGDTVQAVKAHRFAGLFDAPGEMDLTAHVNFGALAGTARNLGFKAYPLVPMGRWLLRMGLELRVAQLMRAASAQAAEDLKSAVGRLVDPAQMGALFKVLTLARGTIAPLPPFS